MRCCYRHVRGGKRRVPVMSKTGTVGDAEVYFRSEAEYTVAVFLGLLGWVWEYEQHEFPYPTRANNRYKPDFLAHPDGGEGEYRWVEVKGYLDRNSAVRLKRFAKYYPNEARRLIIVTDDRRRLAELMASLDNSIATEIEVWSLRRIKELVPRGFLRWTQKAQKAQEVRDE